MRIFRRQRTSRKGLWLGLSVITLVLGSATGAVAFQDGGSRAAAPSRQVAPALPAAQKPFLLGHKGSVNAAVRNTLPAMNAAFAAGADGIEFDIVRTSDERIVVLAGPHLEENTLNCTGLTDDHTYAQLLECTTFDGARMPTLDEALRVVRDHGGKLFLHTKTGPNARIAADIVAALEKYGLNSAGRTTVFGAQPKLLDMLAAAGAERVGLIFQDAHKAAGWSANYPVLIPYETPVTAELVQATRQRGVQVVLVEGFPGTVSEALTLNVDGMILDSITEARAAIGPAVPQTGISAQ